MRVEENPDWRGAIDGYSRETLGDVVKQVHELADRIVPVDTGHLKSRLYSQVDVDGKSGVVGDDADYALYVEAGHRVAYRGSDGVVHYTGDVVPPQPFLRSALNSARLEDT
jgi:hypothetical protein